MLRNRLFFCRYQSPFSLEGDGALIYLCVCAVPNVCCGVLLISKMVRVDVSGVLLT